MRSINCLLFALVATGRVDASAIHRTGEYPQPIAGTFSVRVGAASKTFRHNQQKTAQNWINKQLAKS